MRSKRKHKFVFEKQCISPSLKMRNEREKISSDLQKCQSDPNTEDLHDEPKSEDDL